MVSIKYGWVSDSSFAMFEHVSVADDNEIWMV